MSDYSADIPAFINQAERFQTWCQTALRQWHLHALDPRGGFAEYRYLDGRAIFDAVRRVRVQFRLAYVYALAAKLGWYEDAKAASDHAWDFATGPGFCGQNGEGCAHLVKGDGALDNGFRDTYAQAFVMLAGAWRQRAFNDDRSLAIANQTLNFLDTMVASPFGGWEEGWPIPNSPRRQNPHMHLFEAFLALYETNPDPRYKTGIEKIKRLFDEYFYDPHQHILFEHFENDWSIYQDGGPIEPGHMMEWAWLLSEYERVLGHDSQDTIRRLYDKAMDIGFDKKTGFLVDHCDITGDNRSPHFRSWPQTELIKAGIARVFLGDMDLLPNITQTIKRMFDTYFNTDVKGGWHDQLDASGAPILGHMQSSTFYHIICAAAEVDNLAKYFRTAKV